MERATMAMTLEADARANGPALRSWPSNQVCRLNNVSCAYCGVTLSEATADKEHVIGRGFVPKGKLAGCWNLIVNSCRACNAYKADLEDDISAISMQPDGFGSFGHDDATGTSEAVRKAEKSFSRRTGKLVKNSHEQFKIHGKLPGGATYTVGLSGPPQIDRDRVYQLARMHVAAFFYLITYREGERQGFSWVGGFHPVTHTFRSDWGNPLMRGFADAVMGWEHRVQANGAGGFFRLSIRRHAEAPCWSWAVEWNRGLRVIGFIGDSQTAHAVGNALPTLRYRTVSDGPDKILRVRQEVPLGDDEDDLLFE